MAATTRYPSYCQMKINTNRRSRQGSGTEGEYMNKVGTFFKDCWSDYVAFMGKYGAYVNRF